MWLKKRNIVLATATVMGAASLLMTTSVYAKSPSVTITMYAGSFTPIKPTKDNPNPPTELQVLANRYEKLHPDVKIQFDTTPLALNSAFDSYNGWLTTQGNSGQAPDIVWDQTLQVNSGGYTPPGFFVDLSKYYKQPDPYVKGNKHWSALFPAQFYKQLISPNGATYSVAGDYNMGVIVYNKALFKKAGIKYPPRTFAGFMADLKKLHKDNITPIAYDLSDQTGSTWWEREFGTELLWHQIPKFNVDHAKVYLTALDYAVGIEKGYIQLTNPRYAEVWKLFKDFSKYWASGATNITQAPPTAGSSQVSGLQLVIDGKTAMADTTVGAVPWLKSNHALNKVGFFATFPTITKATTPYSSNIPTQSTIGCPCGSFQYFIPSQQANNTATSDKVKADIDWLQYITKPANAQAVINQEGATIPIVIGSKPSNPALAKVIPTEGPLSMGAFNVYLGPQATDALLRLEQEFVTNQIDYSSFAQQFDADLQKYAQLWATQNNIDLKKYLH